MRYFAVLALLCGVCGPARAVAAPFDELADRLEQFDEQDVPQRRTREQYDDRNAPRQTRTSQRYDDRAMPRQGRSADRFASYPEAVTPEPEPYPAEHPAYDDGSVWDDSYDGFGGCSGDACGFGCGNWCNWANCQCHHFWGRAEYLQWWVRGSNTPALVTTSPDNTPVGAAGVLPGATVLFGDGRINTNGRSGGRFTLGYWFDNCDSFGVENTFLFLGNANDSFSGSSDGSPILARPFFNTQTDAQDARLIGFPDIVVGNINVTSSSQVYGNEINLRRVICNTGCYRFDVLAGYRFFQLNENLRVNENLTSIDEEGTVPVGTTFNIFDQFHTRSQFNGGQLGFNSQFYNGCWSLDVLFKLAIGGVSQTVTIDGQTIVTEPAEQQSTNQGGILALPSNIGQYRRNRFSVIPEFGINLHRQLNRCWKVNLGYTILVVTNVARPGDQIDTQLDPEQFPPPETPGPFQFPQFAFSDSDIWLQGINVGLEYNF